MAKVYKSKNKRKKMRLIYVVIISILVYLIFMGTQNISGITENTSTTNITSVITNLGPTIWPSNPTMGWLLVGIFTYLIFLIFDDYRKKIRSKFKDKIIELENTQSIRKV